MRTLSLGVFAEGPTDTEFLSPLLVRLAMRLIREKGHHPIQVADPIALPGRPAAATFQQTVSSYADSIDLLVVHTDANSSFERAMNERINPWFGKVRDSPSRRDAPVLVPGVPVRETEAWMLGDIQALNTVFGTHKTKREFGLPGHAREVEQITEPKSLLKKLQKLALGQRQARRVGLRPLYTRLGQEVSLDVLNLIPSFARFAGDFQSALVASNYCLPRT